MSTGNFGVPAAIGLDKGEDGLHTSAAAGRGTVGTSPRGTEWESHGRNTVLRKRVARKVLIENFWESFRGAHKD